MLSVCSVSPRHLLSQAQGADGPRLSVTSPHAPLGSKDPSWQSSRDTGLMELVVELMQHYSHLPLVPPVKPRTAHPAPQRGTITALPTRKGGRIGLKPITTIRTAEHLSAMPLPLHSMKEAPQGIQTPFLFCLQRLHWLLDVLLLSRRALIIPVSLKSE